MLQHDLARFGRTVGHDGASAQIWPAPREQGQEDYEDEAKQLLEAWSIVRARAIEAELLLARVRDLIAKAVVPGEAPSTSARRQARRLLAQIDRQIGPEPGRGA